MLGSQIRNRGSGEALSRTYRREEAGRRGGLRQPRKLHRLRPEKDRADPQPARLREGGVHRRDAGRPSETESESEDLVVQSSDVDLSKLSLLLDRVDSFAEREPPKARRQIVALNHASRAHLLVKF